MPTPMKPPAEDLVRRRPVWEALSAVFLDTEIDDRRRERIVSTLRASGYSPAELDRIVWGELCPVLHGNLLAVAGEWSGFDLAEVERRIVSRPAGPLRRWCALLAGGRRARPAWLRIQAALAEPL